MAVKEEKIDKNDPESVTAHIQKLEPEPAEIIETIRQIVLKTDPQIGERIKWNNPSFFYMGAMKPFDPKEYKREIAVFNLYKGRIMMVFPSGAKINDTSGLLTGDYKDGRRLIIFEDLAHMEIRAQDLQNCILDWLKHVEK